MASVQVIATSTLCKIEMCVLLRMLDVSINFKLKLASKKSNE